METNVNYTLAGAFVLMLLTFITLGIIWLSAGISREPYAFYKIDMKESVSGLSKDGPVEFNGVEVGNVAKMRINSTNPQLVELTIKVKKSTPVTIGTRAKLGVRVLTGIAYILLEDKGTDKRPLVSLNDQEYPTSPTTPSFLVRLDTILNQLNENFTKISLGMRNLLNDQNLLEVKNILRSGQKSMRVIETKTLPNANQIADDLNVVSHNLIDISNEMKKDPSILIRGKNQAATLGPGEK